MASLVTTTSYIILQLLERRFDRKFIKEDIFLTILVRIVMQITFFYIAFTLISQGEILGIILGILIIASRLIRSLFIWLNVLFK